MGKTTVMKRIRIEKVVELIGKTIARIKTIRGLVVWCYYYGGTNVNIKLKIVG